MLTIKHRVAILLHEGIRGNIGKTGLAYLRYGQANIVAVIDFQCVGESLKSLTRINRDIPIVTNVTEALNYQPDVLLIGIAPSGGELSEAYLREIKQAVAAGICVANGLHTPLSPYFSSLSPGQWIWDIRQEPKDLIVGKGRVQGLPGQRILTVGTDMVVGKMSTSIELTKAAREQGLNAKFLGTGQGGMMIAGEGICLDAIRVDFAAGAVEQMVAEAAKDHEVVFVEGQGSLLHPGSTATLPLIRGSLPTGLVLVHRLGQEYIHDLPQFPIPPLSQVVKLYETVASGCGIFGQPLIKAIALNTFHTDEITAKKAIAKVTEETGLPCTDVVRFGADLLLKQILD